MVSPLGPQGKLADVVLGFDTVAPYLINRPHFGAICGRFANRIGGAKFTLGACVHRGLPNLLDEQTVLSLSVRALIVRGASSQMRSSTSLSRTTDRICCMVAPRCAR